MVGHLEAAGEALDLNFVYSNGVAKGRAGGLFDGRNVNLTCEGRRVRGMIGELVEGVRIDGRFDPHELEFRIGDTMRGLTVLVALDGPEAQGMIRGATQNLDFEVVRQGQRNEGRFKFQDEPQSSGFILQCEPDVPLSAVVVMGVCAWAALDERSDGLAD
ncbi:hypothetical protein DFI_18630 (plasmid) [Deinococcus ficus]|uniref:Uncharacterized protein n=1 Tax=Deinococcus ficus TaxID=317577 RepID=A0A221T2T9_9DEIO|nr:hypothetical protein DFI_18630 [Deinococcus ficus]